MPSRFISTWVSAGASRGWGGGGWGVVEWVVGEGCPAGGGTSAPALPSPPPLPLTIAIKVDVQYDAGIVCRGLLGELGQRGHLVGAAREGVGSRPAARAAAARPTVARCRRPTAAPLQQARSWYRCARARAGGREGTAESGGDERCSAG